VDRLAFEDRGYVLSRGASAGGRGLNASHVLHDWGEPTIAIVPSGGESGPEFEDMISGFGFPCEVVPIGHSVRTNIIITDQQGLTVKLNERGPQIGAEELDRIETAVRGRLWGASWLLLCGSLPPGVPGSFYARLILLARQQGVKTLLDTDGDGLKEGLTAGPDVVTPNLQETSALLNKALITRVHLRGAVQRILAMGAKSVVLSMGGRGAMAGSGSEIAEIVPPRVDAVCPIGAGDALNAALAWALRQGMEFVEAARWGVAAGTASARLPGLQFATLDQAREIQGRVEIR
jgi:1-phosphofructokinase family hexose kinase